jgi:hypothetical protein
VNLKSLSGGNVPSCLGCFDNGVVELDNVSKMKPRRWRTEDEKDVTVTPRIAVRQRHVELLNGRAHGMPLIIAIWKIPAKLCG